LVADTVVFGAGAELTDGDEEDAHAAARAAVATERREVGLTGGSGMGEWESGIAAQRRESC